MNPKKNSSLLVILISAFQLILMLVIVGFIYQYAQTQLTDRVQTKLFEENQTLLAKCDTLLQSLEGSEAHRKDLAVTQLEQLPLQGERFFLLLDTRSNELVSTGFAHSNSLAEVLGASVKLESDVEIPLEKIVNSPSDIPQSGELIWGERNLIFSGRRLFDGRYLLVCEDSEQALAHVAGVVAPLKKTAFASFLLVGLTGFCGSVLILRRYDTQLHEMKSSLEEKVVARTDELLTTQKAVIYGLAKLAESRDNDTGDHLARIQLYVTILARSLMKDRPEIDEDYIRNLSLASSLHDIGKVGVPDAILLKQGRLTSAERGIMELHTVIGGDCLSSIQSQLGENDFLEMARQIAYFHHERWDGSGYPRGRGEEDIPLCARIVSVADVYDALRTKRPYKQPIPHQESREIILGGTGTQFDPEVVNAFLENEEEFERISAECSKMTAEEVTPKIKILSEMLVQQ